MRRAKARHGRWLGICYGYVTQPVNSLSSSLPKGRSIVYNLGSPDQPEQPQAAEEFCSGDFRTPAITQKANDMCSRSKLAPRLPAAPCIASHIKEGVGWGLRPHSYLARLHVHAYTDSSRSWGRALALPCHASWPSLDPRVLQGAANIERGFTGRYRRPELDRGTHSTGLLDPGQGYLRNVCQRTDKLGVARRPHLTIIAHRRDQLSISRARLALNIYPVKVAQDVEVASRESRRREGPAPGLEDVGQCGQGDRCTALQGRSPRHTGSELDSTLLGLHDSRRSKASKSSSSWPPPRHKRLQKASIG